MPSLTPAPLLDPGPGPSPPPTGGDGLFVPHFRAAVAVCPSDQVWWLACRNIQRVCEETKILVKGELKTVKTNCIWVCAETNDVAIPGRPPLPIDPPGVPPDPGVLLLALRPRVNGTINLLGREIVDEDDF